METAGPQRTEVLVTVRDITPPVIAIGDGDTQRVDVGRTMKWCLIVITASASDACGGTVTCRIVSVTSNEPTSGLGGGDVGPNDWVSHRSV